MRTAQCLCDAAPSGTRQAWIRLRTAPVPAASLADYASSVSEKSQGGLAGTDTEEEREALQPQRQMLHVPCGLLRRHSVYNIGERWQLWRW